MADGQVGPVSIHKGRLLFVEGKDDEVVFTAALRHLGRENDIQIIECRGKDRMPDVFSVYTLQAQFRTVQSYGVIRDADASANSTFQSICSMLRSVGEPEPAQAGGFVSHANRKVGAFVLPNNSAAGSLETLFLTTIANANFVNHINQYVGSLPTVLPQLAPGQQKALGSFYVPHNADKARALAALAGTYEPTLQVGRAAQRGYWDWTNQTIAPLLNFLGAI